MAKLVKRKAPKTEVELRRWCIDQAMRWPTYEERIYGNQVSSGFGSGVVHRTEADVIARAEKLLKWVTA